MAEAPRSVDEVRRLIFDPESYFRPEKAYRLDRREEAQEQQVKRRRLGTRTPHRPMAKSQVTIPEVSSEPSSEVSSELNSCNVQKSYSVVWRRGYPGIKHKRFTGDGRLRVTGSSASLLDSDGRCLGDLCLGDLSSFKLQDFLEGNILLVGSYECQLCE